MKVAPRAPEAGVAGSTDEAGMATTTSSRGSRVVGALALLGLAGTALLALVLSPNDVELEETVRILYVHVPSAVLAYVGFIVCAVASAVYLRRRSQFADLIALAGAEVGLLFCGLCLATGMLWGRPTWGVYWVWDARLTTTALLFLLYLGYLAVRGVGDDPHSRARRAAIVGLVAVVNVPIVSQSVRWWRSLHQDATVLGTADAKMDGLQLFTLMFAFVSFGLLFAWLIMHRFRVAWLQEQVDRSGLDDALAERRAEATDHRAPNHEDDR